MRYFYHPESDSLWVEEKELAHTDGLVEEISYEEYLKLKTKQKGLNMIPPDNVDLRAIKPQMGNTGGHPPGIHDFQITNTYLKENSKKTGALLVCELTSPVGKIEVNFNVINPNAQAVEIANKELSALGHAIGIYQVAYPKMPDGMPNMEMAGHTLRGGRGKMEVVPQMVKGPDGKLVENGYMEVKKFFDLQGNEPGKAGGGAPLTQQSGGGWGNGQAQPQPQPNAAQQTGWQQPQPQAQPQQQPNPAPTGSKPAWAS